MAVAGALAAVFVAAGCGDAGDGGADGGSGGDGGACVEPSFGEPPDGVLASPADLPRDGCEPGTLAGVDPTGLWFVQHDPHPRWQRGPVRISLSCEGGLSVDLATIGSTRPADYAALDADDLFFRREAEYGKVRLVEAYTACRRDADGALYGWYRYCWVGDFGQECGDPASFVARPYGRIEGEPDADGLELVSEFRGGDAPWPDTFTADVRVADGIAYVANGEDGVRIVDVTDPAAPRELAHFPADSDYYNELKLVDGPGGSRYALVASDAAGAKIVDVTDPTAPKQIGLLRPAGEPDHGVHTLFVETVGAATYAYLADGFSPNVFVFDVTDPTSPVDVGTVHLPNDDWGVHAVCADGGRVYAAATVGGLVVVDALPDPAAATVIARYQKDDTYAHQCWKTTTSSGRAVLAFGDEGYGSHLELLDLTPGADGALPRIGEMIYRDQVSIHDMMAFGDTVYVAHYQDGVRIVDISDPTAPETIAHFNTWDPETAPGAMLEGAVGIDVDLDAGLIYVADTPRGLLVLRRTGSAAR
ncbi:MAG: hypothetical protein D6689_12655 [Deltaproteobacteria bacterium]|nr:MAG: hypothetical protein D6689_12655 [Deltaproteobacteria bacterium]